MTFNIKNFFLLILEFEFFNFLYISSLNFFHFWKNGPDKGGGDGDGDGENFLIGNFAENEMLCSQHIKKTIKSFWAKFPMRKFSR